MLLSCHLLAIETPSLLHSGLTRLVQRRTDLSVAQPVRGATDAEVRCQMSAADGENAMSLKCRVSRMRSIEVD